MNTWLIQKSQKKRRLRAKAVKYVPKVKLGLNALLTRILLHMLILPPLNIVKTLTTPKNLRAEKGRVSNGPVKGLG